MIVGGAVRLGRVPGRDVGEELVQAVGRGAGPADVFAEGADAAGAVQLERGRVFGGGGRGGAGSVVAAAAAEGGDGL